MTITPDDLAKLIAENLPSPFALDDVWHLTDDGPQFNLDQAKAYSAEEWRKLANVVLKAVRE